MDRDEHFDIFTHKRWCNHCKNHVDLNVHHETCEYTALKKEVEELRKQVFYMREILRSSYAPRIWDDEV